ncbi:MAG: type II secretion system protein N [Planctomycetota bacterium]|nr:type II secretion system protein N [Planctomycetota bacterium]
MSITTQRNALIALTILLLAAASAAVAWSFSSLSGFTKTATDQTLPRAFVPVPEVNPEPNLDAATISRSLRGPLYDPPPPKPKPKPEPRPTPEPVPPPEPPPPRLEFTLVGTIIEAGQSLAMIEDADGNFDVKGEGESLELTPTGITVRSVASEEVTLDWMGRIETVVLQRGKAVRGGINRNNGRRRNRP